MGGYHPLDSESCSRWVARFLPGGAAQAEEIGDGNLNLVFRVISPTGRSLVVKQALPYLRVAPEWPLAKERAKIEAVALAEFTSFDPAHAPALVHFDESMCALVLEDLVHSEPWREALIRGDDAGSAPEDAATFAAAAIASTDRELNDTANSQQLAERFPRTPLCGLTERLVLQDPFQPAPTNRYDPALQPAVTRFQQDPAVQAAAAQALRLFREDREALLHGDLHTGSVMVGPRGAKIIDFEFAFFGPRGFDVGLLLANLVLAHHGHRASGDLAYCASIRNYAIRFWHEFDAQLTARTSRPDRVAMVKRSILRQAQLFAGAEVCRRVVSLAHVRDIDDLPLDAALTASRAALASGRELLTSHPATSFDQLWSLATKQQEE
jgi:5-methylthioribose kinase